MKLGDYELLREHGGIGAGTVWSARAASDTAESPKLFSVVRIHKHLLKKADVADAFNADAKPAVGFRHANVATLVHAGDVGGELLAVSDHHEGELLSALATAAGADGLPLPVVVRIGLDVLEALAAAHEHEPALFHGELGPHHILVGADGVSRVLGLGTARGLSRIAPPLGVKNQDRLSYAAPERVKAMSSPLGSVAAAAPLDARVDLFSVGVMLWEGVMKTRLFASKIDAAIVQKVLTAPIAALSTVNAPATLDDAVQKALERDPTKRTRSAAMMIAALEGLDPDQIATSAQVAEVVEKIAGKAIAARRAEVSKPASAAPAASVKVGEPAVARPVVQPRKATLLGIASPAAKSTAPPSSSTPAAPASSKPEAAPVAGSKPVTPSKPEAKPLSVPKPAAAGDTAKPASTPKPIAAVAADMPAPRPPALSSEEISEMVEVVDATSGNAKKAPPGPPPKRPAALAETPKPASVKEPESSKAAPAKTDAAEPTKPSPIAALQATTAETPKAVAPSTKAATPSQLLESASKTSHTPGTDGPSPASRARSLGSEKVGPGSTLGRYEILTPVARGGMASVWAARLPGSRGFQKIFAIKTMLPDVSDDPDFENMFLDEGRVAARIRHPNVVEIIDLGEQDEVLYLVMEWVDGENLGALVKAARAIGGVPLPIVLKIASQIASGLHAAHELRDDDGNLVDLVHRDVSPANVLVSTSGYVKIVDFGIAKSKGRLHQTRVGGVVKGKTPYLSPEQLGQLPIDRRSDLFSLGVLLYVLTTGLHPFRGETDAKTIENIALREPVPLRNIVPSTPPEFEAVVLKALSKDAKDRFSTAAEMHRAIEQAANATGMTTTEEDIAAFVKKALGEAITKRAQDLRAAIDRADGRVPSIAEAEAAPDSIDPLAATEMQADGSAVKTAAITMPEIASDAKPAEDVKPAETDVAIDESAKPLSTPAPHLAMPPPPPEPASPPVSVGSAIAAAQASSPSESTDAPLEIPEAPPRRKPVALVAVGAVLGLCVIIGGIALVSGGSKPEGSPRAATTSAATAPVRTATPAPTAPQTPPAPTPTAAETASAAPAETAPPAETASPAKPQSGGKTAPIKPAGKPAGGNTKKQPGKFNPTGI